MFSALTQPTAALSQSFCGPHSGCIPPAFCLQCHVLRWARLAATSADKRQWTKRASREWGGSCLRLRRYRAVSSHCSYCQPWFYLWVNELYKNIREKGGRKRRGGENKKGEGKGKCRVINQDLGKYLKFWSSPMTVQHPFFFLPYRASDHSGVYSYPRGPVNLEGSSSCWSTEH